METKLLSMSSFLSNINGKTWQIFQIRWVTTQKHPCHQNCPAIQAFCSGMRDKDEHPTLSSVYANPCSITGKLQAWHFLMTSLGIPGRLLACSHSVYQTLLGALGEVNFYPNHFKLLLRTTDLAFRTARFDAVGLVRHMGPLGQVCDQPTANASSIFAQSQMILTFGTTWPFSSISVAHTHTHTHCIWYEKFFCSAPFTHARAAHFCC